MTKKKPPSLANQVAALRFQRGRVQLMLKSALEDMESGRFISAHRWLEIAVADGEDDMPDVAGARIGYGEPKGRTPP